MKLIKTIKIKVGDLSNNKTNILNVLLNRNTKAINFCLNKAKKGKTITHQLVYQDLRNMNLPATVVHSCRAKSIEILKSFKKKKGKKTFPLVKNPAIRFDNQVVQLRKTDNALYKYFISLLYKAGVSGKSNNRIELPLIINSNWQKDIINKIGNGYELGSTELIKRGDEFYIHISYSKEINIPRPDNSFSPIGIDVGIHNLAVSVAQSSVVFHSGKRINWKNNFYRKERARLQSNFAMQEVKRLKGKQRKFNQFVSYNIAKRIVEQAKKEEKPVIVMEDLTHIDGGRSRKKIWFFRRLQHAVEVKALWEEIPVIYIEPRYSSQICSKCGELNKRDRHTYKCLKCGYEANADYNAGRNLQQLFRAKCLKEQASINNAFNGTMPEPQATKGRIVKNITTNKGVSVNFSQG